MPRRVRRRRLLRKRYYRRRSRTATMRGKRKAAKGQRQSEQYCISMEIDSPFDISPNIQVNLEISAFDQLFTSAQFLNMKSGYDQFRLDSCRLSATVSCQGLTSTSPYIIGYAVDRNGLPYVAAGRNPNDVKTYGSYRYANSNASGKATASISVSATTMQEKSQYLPTDILGVAPIATRVLDPTVIPRYRSIYFPFNPVFIFYSQANYAGATFNAKFRGRMTFYVTFRGVRTVSQQNDNLVGIPAPVGAGVNAGGAAGGVGGLGGLGVPVAGAQPIVPPGPAVRGIQNVISQVGVAGTGTGSLISLTSQSTRTTHPQFNAPSLIVDGLNELGRALYDRVVSLVVDKAAASVPSLIKNIGLFGLSLVKSASLSNSDGSFLASSPGTTFYYTNEVATNGIPQGSGNTSVTALDYIDSTELGTHLKNFVDFNAIRIFNDDSYCYNDNSSFILMQHQIQSNLNLLRALVNQDDYGTTLVQWTSISAIASSGIVTVPAGKVILMQYAHANYWVTCLIFNRYFTDGGSTLTDFSFKPSELQRLCSDGNMLFNTDVSPSVYVSTIPSSISTYAGLTLSVSPRETGSSAPQSANPVYSMTMPVGVFSIGYGMPVEEGFIDNYITSTFVGLPLFYSKNKLFN